MISIGNILNKLTFLLLLVVANHAWSQVGSPIYTSPVHCVADVSSGGGMTGGTGGGSQGCLRPSVFFDMDTTRSLDRTWTLGDGSSFTGRNFNYTYPSAGNYTVTLQREGTRDGITVNEVETEVISVGTYPVQPEFNGNTQADTTVCGQALSLNPYGLRNPAPLSDYSYLWFPGGETTQTIEVQESGCYSVEVTNNITGCTRSARINVTFCLESAAQGGGSEEWYFGQGATLEFAVFPGIASPRDSLASQGEFLVEEQIDSTTRSVSAIDLAGSNLLNTNKATAMVYDPSGALAFYTDGINIYDGEDALLTDANGNSLINADSSLSQGLVIIPKTNCNECPHHEYYIFYVDKTTKILSRATIDLRVNNGAGGITEIGVPVSYPVTEKINATLNDDETGYVIFSQERESNTINITTVDSSGTQTIQQGVGSIKTDESNSGYLAVNQEGNQIAVGVVNNGQNYLEVYDYDKPNNALNFVFEIDLGIPAPPNVYGIEFSENGDFIYVTLQGSPNTGTPSYLLQVPILLGSPADITAGIEVIDQSSTEVFGALKLGPVNGDDTKSIYMAIEGRSEIPFIQQPDIRGGAINIGYSRVSGSAVTGVNLDEVMGVGLPNVIFAVQQQSGDGLSASYSGNCFNAPTQLKIEEVCSPLRNEVEWNFEDGTSIKGAEVAYTFPKQGWNTFSITVDIYNSSPLKGLVNNQILNKALELTETICTDTILVDSIYIKESPISAMPESDFFCTREARLFTIDPRVSGGNTFIYRWSTVLGATIGTGSVLVARAPGIYKLEVENEFECKSEDEIELINGCVPRLFVGEAITPNGDGVNDDLKIEAKYITDFNLLIYNRWGELVFESDDLDTRWDGRVNGKILSPSVYTYLITYKALDLPNEPTKSLRGSLWVFK